jgi:putative transferase (TIGR04331 family)
LVNIIKTTLPKIYRKLLKISFSDFISGLFHIQPKTNIKVGILGSFFSPSFFNTLIIKSKGAILPIRTNMSFRSTPGPNLGMRSVLSSIDSGFDKFDRFFFTSLTACFPKEFLEDFSQIESYYLEYFKKYESLKYIVSERWIGDTNTSTALAILKTNGVKHIYNEHNFLSQQFAGNSNKYLMSMVDHFVTLGWYEKGIDNLVRGASLFEFSLKKRQNKIHDILFIQGLACVKLPEFNVSYGEFGSANADRFLQFNDSFFKSLSKATLNKITYRPYPVNSWLVSSVLNPMISYDYQYTFLQKYLVDCKEINTASGNSKVLISQSKLVVINYLSTAYLEALLSDVPTIFFWNKESYYLDDKYSGFYDLLTSVGICQTDPVKAAMFIEGIAERPDEWWFSDPVRNARNSFLTTNFGEPQKMVDYLIELAKV